MTLNRIWLCILMFCASALAQDVNTYIPIQAKQYLPVLKTEQVKFWYDHPKAELLASLIEHESCISLKHSRCWSPKSQLKSAREEGAGFAQLTRAFNQSGSIRFDALDEIRKKHYTELKDLSWGNIYDRPDLQLRATVLKMRDNYQYYNKPGVTFVNAYSFADAAYNGGIGGLDNERRACKISSNCNPAVWDNNVELFCLKSKAALYGQRSACDINRHHVKDVLVTRAPKYKVYFD